MRNRKLCFLVALTALFIGSMHVAGDLQEPLRTITGVVLVIVYVVGYKTIKSL